MDSGQAGDERIIGRYAIYDMIAAGGMATVHFGRLIGPVGFTRTVAIKRLHPQFAKDPEFVTMFLDEARLAARIRHPNVVPTLDVVATEGELFLVMEYVQGESLARVFRAAAKAGIPPPIAVAIVCNALQGLHAAHEAKNDRGEPMNLVHRDVSPQNILVGVDGVARVLDFGVAKAAGRVYTTREGTLKGKLPYMAPEQLRGGEVSRKADVYSAAVVLWEVLTGKRLFAGQSEGEVFGRVLEEKVSPPSALCEGLSEEVDRVCLHGLLRNPEKRFATAREMALALERAQRPATQSEVAQWIESLIGPTVVERAVKIAAIEAATSPTSRPKSPDAARVRDAVSPTDPRPAASLAAPSEPNTGLSQVSSISVSRPLSRSSARRVAGVGILAAVALAAGVAFLVSRRGSESVPAPSTSSPMVTQFSTAPPQAPPSIDSVAASEAPSASGAATAAKAPRKVPARHPVGSPERPDKRDCYYFDSTGIKHVRPECL